MLFNHPQEHRMFLSRFRKAVDTCVPPLGRSYRLLRDATNRRKSIQTKYGFTLAGDPSMASYDCEADEIKAFLELIETHDVVLDVGSNVGLYSCLAAHLGKHVIAFEPASRNLNFFYRNLWDNRFSSVEVFPLGLAARSGLGRIYGYGGIASFVPGWAQARKAQSSLVPLTTLDNIAADRFKDKKLLIKMDVEGFELDVLAGAAKTLSLSPKPAWIVEISLSGDLIPGGINPKFAPAFDVFWRHGYSCLKLDSTRTKVEPSDVNRWVVQGFVDGGTHDFLFSAD
jgi:FkbM family methyltransferase